MRVPDRSADAARHRLLEGVLLRLARRPDADALVLRGGVLLRHWLGPAARPALDLDLVAPGPITPDEARRYLPLLADTGVTDGVTFDPDRVRVLAIWGHTDHPGVRVQTRGSVDGREVDVQVDVTGGPAPRPAAVLLDLPTAAGLTARVWACRPESVVGQKVQALCHLGQTGWRPKDLYDVRLVLARVPLDAGPLREAVDAYLADLGQTRADARAALGPGGWWGTKAAAARWGDFARGAGPDAPRNLPRVAAEVAGWLAPIMGGAG